MKTKKSIRTLAIMALMIFTISVYADGKNTSKKSTILKTDKSDTLIKDSNQKSNVFDTCICSVEETENELKVEKYIPLEEIIPAWMIIENEPELEVVEIKINK